MDRNGVGGGGVISKGLEQGVIHSVRSGMLFKEVLRRNLFSEVFIFLFDVAYFTGTGRSV